MPEYSSDRTVDSSNVLPLPETLPIDDLSDANVLVHVGADLFPDQGG